MTDCRIFSNQCSNHSRSSSSPSEDVHVETERIHSGALNDEIAHDGLEDWNPLDDDLDSDEPCDVYPLSNGWIVVAPKNWN